MKPISDASLSSIPTCYATVSVGTPEHDLKDKLKAIAYAGFKGIELGFPDLLAFASKRVGRDVGPQEFDILCKHGLDIKRICKELCLKIVMLQPFANFEGWKPQSEERQDAFKRAKGWIRIMEALGTDMLQASDSSLPGLVANVLPLLGWFLRCSYFHSSGCCYRRPPRARRFTSYP